MITNEAILDNYETSVSCLKEYYVSVKASDAASALPQPPTAKVNKHNINNVCNALYKVRLSWNIQDQVSWPVIIPIWIDTKV